MPECRACRHYDSKWGSCVRREHMDRNEIIGYNVHPAEDMNADGLCPRFSPDPLHLTRWDLMRYNWSRLWRRKR